MESEKPSNAEDRVQESEKKMRTRQLAPCGFWLAADSNLHPLAAAIDACQHHIVVCSSRDVHSKCGM